VWTGDKAGPVTPPDPRPPLSKIPEGWLHLEGPRSMTLTQAPARTPEDAVKAAIARCGEEAKGAKGLAQAVANPDASLAVSAPRHVIARHLARAACGVALLRVGLLPPSPARDEFYTSLKEAEANWKSMRGREGHLPR
jgi:hypothetical protein